MKRLLLLSTGALVYCPIVSGRFQHSDILEDIDDCFSVVFDDGDGFRLVTTAELPEGYQSEEEEEEEENNDMRINLLETATRSICIEENRIIAYPAGHHYANRPNFFATPAESKFQTIFFVFCLPAFYCFFFGACFIV